MRRFTPLAADAAIDNYRSEIRAEKPQVIEPTPGRNEIRWGRAAGPFGGRFYFAWGCFHDFASGPFRGPVD